MANRHASTLDKRGLSELLDAVVQTNKQPLEMKAAFMLSFYAGLRVQEIAGLRWAEHVVDHEGKIRTEEYPVTLGQGEFLRDQHGDLIVEVLPTIFIGDDISKYTGERNIPIHPDLVPVLEELYALRDPDSPWVIPSGYQSAGKGLRHRAHALRMRIRRIYDKLDMEGFSSHSGRRSYISRAARIANAHGASLRDIQSLAGHSSIRTTEKYIDENASAQARVTNGVW